MKVLRERIFERLLTRVAQQEKADAVAVNHEDFGPINVCVQFAAG
jgi:hypothetical protein